MKKLTRGQSTAVLSIALTCILIPGCRVGGLGTQDTIARLPGGIRVLMEMGEGRLVGELLEIRSEGLLLHADTANSTAPVGGVIVLVPPDAVPTEFRAGTSWPTREEQGRRVRLSSEAHRTWLQGLSRFPYGMSPEVEQRLLTAYGQSEIARPGSAPPEETDLEAPDADGFLAEVSRAVDRYRDRSVAIRYGYRRVGPDFPGMGEHWVNPGLILSGGVDASRPQILTYLEIDGAIHLTGAAFAVPLGRGEAPPAAPLGSHVWHDHGGSLDEEALVLESPTSMHHDPDGPRLAMFHTWLWPENPDGPLAQNNWTLPWVRIGLEPPARPDPFVARALSLGGEGADYYRLLLVRAAGLVMTTEADAETARILEAAVSRASDRVSAILEGRAGGRVLTPAEETRLRVAWTELWDEIRRDVGDQAWSRLRPAFEAWGSG
jgi:hypothetical protein